MEIINTLFSDKKTVIIMAIAYVIVMVVALIIIWKPDTVLEVSKYESYNEEEKKQEMATYYFGTVRSISAYNLKEILNPIISQSYLNYSEKSIDDVMLELSSQYTYPVITDIKSYNVGDKVIYTGKLIKNGSSNNSIPVCIIENYPYDFELTLDNFVDYLVLNRSTTKEGIRITVKEVYKNIEYIQYNLYIENENSDYLTMDFSNTTNAYVTVDNSQRVYLNNSYDTPELKHLETKGVAIRDIIFRVPVNEQDKIQSISFKNVIIDGKKVDIEIIL